MFAKPWQGDLEGAEMGGSLRQYRAPLIVEIQDDKLCVYPTDGQPAYYDLAKVEKILPKMIEFKRNQTGLL